MLRCLNGSMLRPARGAASLATATAPAAIALPARQFHSVYGIMGSCLMCGACMLCFGSWANNYCNVKKYGRWRFRNSIDDVIMVSDFRGARYFGAFLGFLFWWFVVGPQKYRWNSNLADIPGNTRIGPF
ncbi:conserved hypothetical protein [Leishmania mexicana MHOM/GT/2001/U1103]|uniref:Uncharacterized protein n=1 Tax=Leishmania mexicana (strain MHOM/GT/2001/U1103) TaxID=929439 RepID=E9B0T7_LEIMU|nr:conserved hypothetical protein [Leishmania mexicana MHOM/GT/2001/U1103]CBZ28842.1 conserved hypothetical protein [Leishmania mexicana MHOM/GT/2001/U1103]